MHSLIESLRGKSETYRRVVALTTSLAVTLVIAGVWTTVTFPGAVGAGSLSASTAKRSGAASVSVASAVSATQQGPDVSFSSNVSQTFESAKKQWNNIKEYFQQTTYEANSQLKELEALSPEEYAKQNATTNSAR